MRSEFRAVVRVTNSGTLAVNPHFTLATADRRIPTHNTLTATSSPDIEPDDYPISISPLSFEFGGRLFTSVIYSVQGTPCFVRSRKELEIRDLSVVEDPVRTAPGHAWTFGKLMEDMAPTAAAAPAMVKSLLSTWPTDQKRQRLHRRGPADHAGFHPGPVPADRQRRAGSRPRGPTGTLTTLRPP